jgi:hypothetical protein
MSPLLAPGWRGRRDHGETVFQGIVWGAGDWFRLFQAVFFCILRDRDRELDLGSGSAQLPVPRAQDRHSAEFAT